MTFTAFNSSPCVWTYPFPLYITDNFRRIIIIPVVRICKLVSFIWLISSCPVEKGSKRKLNYASDLLLPSCPWLRVDIVCRVEAFVLASWSIFMYVYNIYNMYIYIFLNRISVFFNKGKVPRALKLCNGKFKVFTQAHYLIQLKTFNFRTIFNHRLFFKRTLQFFVNNWLKTNKSLLQLYV